MPTYSDEINVYNPDAIDNAIGEAATTATSYITSVTSDGIMVADANKGASNGSITANTTGWHIGGVLEFIRNGVARFWIGLKSQNDTTPTVRIGKEYVQGATDNESHMELDYHSMKMVDKESLVYFYVSDLRDLDGYITETWDSDGLTTVFDLSAEAINSLYVVRVDGVEVTDGISKSTESITFTRPPIYGTTITAYYIPRTPQVTKAYTFGQHRTGKLGLMSVAEGLYTSASGNFSHVEGRSCKAIGYCSHAEGEGTEAIRDNTHAEGKSTEARGRFSHAEGWNCVTTADADASHAEGLNTIASGNYSHAQNQGTYAIGANQTAIGKYNVVDTWNKYALIVGNGTADDARSNAFAVTWDGTVEHANDIVTTTPSDVLTPASGVTINFANYEQWGKVAAMYVSCKKSSAIAANTATALFTMKEGRRPLFENVGNLPVGNGDCYVNGEGVVSVRQRTQINANTNIYIRITYLLA